MEGFRCQRNSRQPPAVLVHLGEGRYRLQGDLIFGSAAAVLRTVQDALRKVTGDVDIDLAGIRCADSAGVALLIELLRFARQRNIALTFSQISQQLGSLAAVSGVDALLPRRS